MDHLLLSAVIFFVAFGISSDTSESITFSLFYCRVGRSKENGRETYLHVLLTWILSRINVNPYSQSTQQFIESHLRLDFEIDPVHD